jgi:hypothetical protein
MIFARAAAHHGADTMDSSQLTTAQAEKIKDAIGPTVGYPCRLVQRMERRGFSGDDRFFQRAKAAYDAMYSLSIDLHYRSIPCGVGEPPKK